MTSPLLAMTSFSAAMFSSSCCGKKILPSFATQPLDSANWMTAPSDSKKRRFFAFEMGSDG